MKIFEIKTQGESDFVTANTNIHALQVYSNFTDIILLDYDDTDEIIEIPESEWGERKIVDPDDPYNDDKMVSFADYMKDAVTPELFCTTNF